MVAPLTRLTRYWVAPATPVHWNVLGVIPPQSTASPLAPIGEINTLVALTLKLAVTDLLPDMTTEPGLVVPLAFPLQLLKTYPEAGAAVSVTVVPAL